MNKPQRVSSHRPSAAGAVPTQFDLFAPNTSRLPDDSDLIRLFNVLNVRHFNGVLPPARVEWSSRLRIAGNCYPKERIIRLSVRYHTHYPEEIEKTLLHEMLHLVYPGHDRHFKVAAAKLGISIHCREYPDMHPRLRYTYVCPGCRTVYHRQKRANVSCGKCSGGRYDPRYKLVLKKST